MDFTKIVASHILPPTESIFMKQEGAGYIEDGDYFIYVCHLIMFVVLEDKHADIYESFKDLPIVMIFFAFKVEINQSHASFTD